MGHESDRNDVHYELLLDALSDQAATTSWDEYKTATKTVIEASSTTYERNTRFGLLENGTWVTPDRFDTLATPVGPLYEFTVPDGETYLVTGKERNPYTPGEDYTSAFATQFGEAGAGDDIVPSGITITQGLGDFRDGQREGLPLIFTPDDAVFGTFKNDELIRERSLAAGEWLFDPVASDHYEYDVTKFAVKRLEGNFYGSGSQNLFFKLRDVDSGAEEYLNVAEVGDPDDPVVDVFNLYNQVKVENASGSPYTFAVGPLQYFNEGPSTPGRGKTSIKRDVSVSASFDDTAGTVIAVYRKDPSNIEVPVSARVGGKAQSDGEVELREVHPDYIDFGTIDETDDANWGPPTGLRQRETGLQELSFTVGDVSILTDSGRARGEQASVAVYDGSSTGGGSSSPARADERETINEFNYFVTTVKHESTSEPLERYELMTAEAW